MWKWLWLDENALLMGGLNLDTIRRNANEKRHEYGSFDWKTWESRPDSLRAEVDSLRADIERLRAAMSWLAGHEPELVEQAREKYKLN